MTLEILGFVFLQVSDIHYCPCIKYVQNQKAWEQLIRIMTLEIIGSAFVKVSDIHDCPCIENVQNQKL